MLLQFGDSANQSDRLHHISMTTGRLTLCRGPLALTKTGMTWASRTARLQNEEQHHKTMRILLTEVITNDVMSATNSQSGYLRARSRP
jgi:hypothetical protein